MSTPVKMLDLVPRIILSLKAAPGSVIPSGLVEPVVQVEPAMTFQVVGSTVGIEVAGDNPRRSVLRWRDHRGQKQFC